jgi:hypothetical protein
MADVITERRWCEEEQDADNSCHGIGSSCLRSLKASPTITGAVTGFEGFEGSGHLITVMPVPLGWPYMWSYDALLVPRLPRLMPRDSAARPAN